MARGLGGISASAAAFWDRNGEAIEGFSVYTTGILVYALIVNLFYQHISKRVMFAGRTVRGRTQVPGPGRGWIYLMLFPIVSFAFFLLLSLSLLFLGSRNQTPAQVVTFSFSLVAAIRIAAYFSEATSHDVAKMLPLGLLGVVIVQAEFSSLAESSRRLRDLVDYADLVAFFFLIVVALEYGLRAFYIFVLHEQPPHRRGGRNRASRARSRMVYSQYRPHLEPADEAQPPPE